jgi:hypothetical protein
MKRFAAALSLLVVLSIVLTAMAPMALAATVDPVAPDPGGDHVDNPITWTPALLNVAVGAGETVQASASFTSTMGISGAALAVSFPLSRYVSVSPSNRFDVVAGAANPVSLTVSLPAMGVDDAMPIVSGMVQVVSNGRIYSRPLMVTITRKIQTPPIAWRPNSVQLQVTVPSISSAMATPPSSASVVFSSTVAIAGARLRASAPLNMVLDLSPAGPVTVTPGLSYTVNMTAHVPAAVTDVATLDSQGRRIVMGQVEVYNSSQVYARSLPVTVVLEPAPQATITWNPWMAPFLLSAGESSSQVVTATSNLTVENATLKVTGPIAPYVTAHLSATSFRPNTPLPVTLQVTAPVPFVWPIAGSVAVVDGSGRVLSHDLNVVLSPQPQPQPAEIRWQPHDVVFKLNEGQSSSRVVTATSDLALANATLRVTGPIAAYLTVSPSPLSFAAGTPVQVTLVVTAPVAPSMWPMMWPVGGEVVVVDSSGRPLHEPLDVVIYPAYAEPVISWQPPMVLFGVDASVAASAGRVVTLTSSITVENATLKVTGPITPYLSVTPHALTLLPGVATPIRLAVTSPASPVFYRPLAGDVVVVDSAGHVLRHELKVMIMWQRPRTSN